MGRDPRATQFSMQLTPEERKQWEKLRNRMGARSLAEMVRRCVGLRTVQRLVELAEEADG